MKRPVQWSAPAAGSLFTHLEFLHKQSAKAAALVRERVLTAASGLSPMQTGRPGRKKGTFELYVSKTSLMMIYRITDEGKVRILRFMHTSRDFKAGDLPAAD
jgi:toxin ParE1/3/4